MKIIVLFAVSWACNSTHVELCYTQACVCLVRYYRRKSIKTLRFDNPVYRAKSEEDQFTLNMARHHAASSLPPVVSTISH